MPEQGSDLSLWDSYAWYLGQGLKSIFSEPQFPHCKTEAMIAPISAGCFKGKLRLIKMPGAGSCTYSRCPQSAGLVVDFISSGDKL